MQERSHTAEAATSAKDTVLSFIHALNDENFDAAMKYVTDAMIFDGVMGVRNGAADYFKDMQKMKLKYAVQKVFADGKDVCLMYEITMSGQSIFSCGWYKVEKGKISSIKVVFDPRPLLEAAKK